MSDTPLCNDPEHAVLNDLITRHLRQQIGVYERKILKVADASPEDLAVYNVLVKIHDDALRDSDDPVFARVVVDD